MAAEQKLITAQEFARTMFIYQETAISSGGLKAMEYSKGAESGKATNTGNSQNVQPSPSDLICDIELAARKALKPGDFSYFTLYYKTCDVVVQLPEAYEELDDCLENHVASFPEHQQAAVRSIDSRMREVLGAYFIQVGISPTKVYMGSVDVRSPRKPKRPWSHLD